MKSSASASVTTTMTTTKDKDTPLSQKTFKKGSSPDGVGGADGAEGVSTIGLGDCANVHRTHIKDLLAGLKTELNTTGTGVGIGTGTGTGMFIGAGAGIGTGIGIGIGNNTDTLNNTVNTDIDIDKDTDTDKVTSVSFDTLAAHLLAPARSHLRSSESLEMALAISGIVCETAEGLHESLQKKTYVRTLIQID